MKICICSSFKYYQDVIDIKNRYESENLEILIPVPNPFKDKKIEDQAKTPIIDKQIVEAYWRHLNDHLKRMDQADIVYIYSKDGYIGNGVSLEIGYAYANKKKIYSSELLNDLPLSCFIDGIVTIENLIKRTN